MYLYDGTSDVDFFYAGTMTHAEISDDPSLADLVSAPCVLYDDGAGRVYRFDRLDVLADRYGIDMTDDAEQTFASVLSAMEKIPPDRAEQALEMAETAQQAANEAKSTAGTAAASVDEYMDALLGLGTTNETEATDAE